MERKLASIQQVTAVEPIPNADFIAKARVMGWDVIVRKDEVKEGDKVVFFEIDSLLPDIPEFTFMAKHRFRVRTMKMKGVLSQGLAMPVCTWTGLDSLPIGEDVTERLCVSKYEPPIHPSLMGMARSTFPTHLVPKTDETRIQSALDVLDELTGKQVYITTKCDGTSFTAYLTEDNFGVCSRNMDLKPSDVVYWKIARKLDLLSKMLRLKEIIGGHDLAIQGELCGPGIRKNRMGISDYHLYLFNIWDITNGNYLDFSKWYYEAPSYGLEVVPLNNESIHTSIFNFTLEELLELAKGNYANTSNPREGVVIRPCVETYSLTLQGRLSIKVLNNDYLLKEE